MHVPGKEVHQYVPDALSRLCENNMPPKTTVASSSHGILAAMVPTFHIPDAIFRVIAKVHNSEVGHHGLQMCKKRLKAQGFNFTDRMVTQFIRQCPCCQVMNRLRNPIQTHTFCHPARIVRTVRTPLGDMYVLYVPSLGWTFLPSGGFGVSVTF